MAASARHRATADFGQLGPVLRAYARARSMPVSMAVRQAVAKMLDIPRDDAEHDGTSQDEGRLSKVTVRMPSAVVARLRRDADAAGLSYGIFLASLIDGTPAPPLREDHRYVVAALGRSTDELAALSADLRRYVRLLGSTTVPHLEEQVLQLAEDIRAHLRLASKVVAELKPRSRKQSAVHRRGAESGRT